MKLRILSDLHLEFGDMRLSPGGDILVLAGDVGVIKKPSYFYKVAEWAEMFEYVIYVPGNHEYYKGSLDASFNSLRSWSLTTNIHVLDNNLVRIGDTVFIGSTLWSDLSDPIAAIHADSNMNDFAGLIRYNNYANRFRASDATEKFNVSVAYLEAALSKIQEHKIVVVTHHAPTFQSVSEIYKGDALNCAFASDLEWMMEKYNPKLWIHGHMHNSVDMQIHNTHIICNPRGYVGYEVNSDFNPYLEVDI